MVRCAAALHRVCQEDGQTSGGAFMEEEGVAPNGLAGSQREDTPSAAVLDPR